MNFPLESLLSAKQILDPKLAGDEIFFVSDIAGSYSLYKMNRNGGFPEALLPSGTALQNPHLMDGYLYEIFPKLKKIIVMMDKNGDENYQPNIIPMDGGIPEPLFGTTYQGQKVICTLADDKANIIYFARDDRKNPGYTTSQVKLEGKHEQILHWSKYGCFPACHSKNHEFTILIEGYIAGDSVIYKIDNSTKALTLISGTPYENRKKDEKFTRHDFRGAELFENKLLISTTDYNDLGGLALLGLDGSGYEPVKITGLQHTGKGEFTGHKYLEDNYFTLSYNIDGVTWIYEAIFTLKDRTMKVTKCLVGQGVLSNGIDVGNNHQRTPKGFEYVVSFTKASSPVQIYYISPDNKSIKITNEKALGIQEKFLSSGESANYKSFDGLEVSARLYLPSKELNYKPPYPLVEYVHGGPQGQERPDFTWFSMPLIQYLTLNGFAVFVPNVRGSTGYGLKYMKYVDHDWGGDDIKDHIEGLKMLEKDSRIDSTRRAVVGRSYGGFMTLSLISRHPELWKAGCDMFGPYNLISFVERLPPSWKEFFYIAIGNPDNPEEKKFLDERSPKTYIDQVTAPLLVIQGRNDPRVVVAESQDIVDRLSNQEKTVEILLFEDEGHDVIKFKNKVICYQKIVDFFKKYLM